MLSDAPSPLRKGPFADRYRLERPIGEGGMATVYLAEDLRHRRRVAVKVLKSQFAEALGSERFLREITTTANLRHPNISCPCSTRATPTVCCSTSCRSSKGRRCVTE